MPPKSKKPKSDVESADPGYSDKRKRNNEVKNKLKYNDFQDNYDKFFRQSGSLAINPRRRLRRQCTKFKN